MSQSLAKVAVHFVFSTKYRTPWLWNRALCTELYRYMSSILRDTVNSPAIAINGVEDHVHVHVLLLLSRTHAIAKVIEVAKSESSKWVKRQTDETRGFRWQSGYGVVSVSESNIPRVRHYIQDQERHHRRMSFQREFRELCIRHALKLDERYAWD